MYMTTIVILKERNLYMYVKLLELISDPFVESIKYVQNRRTGLL